MWRCRAVEFHKSDIVFAHFLTCFTLETALRCELGVGPLVASESGTCRHRRFDTSTRNLIDLCCGQRVDGLVADVAVSIVVAFDEVGCKNARFADVGEKTDLGKLLHGAGGDPFRVAGMAGQRDVVEEEAGDDSSAKDFCETFGNSLHEQREEEPRERISLTHTLRDVDELGVLFWPVDGEISCFGAHDVEVAANVVHPTVFLVGEQDLCDEGTLRCRESVADVDGGLKGNKNLYKKDVYCSHFLVPLAVDVWKTVA